jgi:hypothetical protein
MNKGCYIGQEMVTRTEFLGESRKDIYKIYRLNGGNCYFLFNSMEDNEEFFLKIWNEFEKLWFKTLQMRATLELREISSIWDSCLQAWVDSYSELIQQLFTKKEICEEKLDKITFLYEINEKIYKISSNDLEHCERDMAELPTGALQLGVVLAQRLVGGLALLRKDLLK